MTTYLMHFLIPLFFIFLTIFIISKLGQRKHRKITSMMQVPENKLIEEKQQ